MDNDFVYNNSNIIEYKERFEKYVVNECGNIGLVDYISWICEDYSHSRAWPFSPDPIQENQSFINSIRENIQNYKLDIETENTNEEEFVSQQLQAFIIHYNNTSTAEHDISQHKVIGRFIAVLYYLYPILPSYLEVPDAITKSITGLHNMVLNQMHDLNREIDSDYNDTLDKEKFVTSIDEQVMNKLFSENESKIRQTNKEELRRLKEQFINKPIDRMEDLELFIMQRHLSDEEYNEVMIEKVSGWDILDNIYLRKDHVPRDFHETVVDAFIENIKQKISNNIDSYDRFLACDHVINCGFDGGTTLINHLRVPTEKLIDLITFYESVRNSKFKKEFIPRFQPKKDDVEYAKCLMRANIKLLIGEMQSPRQNRSSESKNFISLCLDNIKKCYLVCAMCDTGMPERDMLSVMPALYYVFRNQEKFFPRNNSYFSQRYLIQDLLLVIYGCSSGVVRNIAEKTTVPSSSVLSQVGIFSSFTESKGEEEDEEDQVDYLNMG